MMQMQERSTRLNNPKPPGRITESGSRFLILLTLQPQVLVAPCILQSQCVLSVCLFNTMQWQGVGTPPPPHQPNEVTSPWRAGLACCPPLATLLPQIKPLTINLEPPCFYYILISPLSLGVTRFFTSPLFMTPAPSRTSRANSLNCIFRDLAPFQVFCIVSPSTFV